MNHEMVDPHAGREDEEDWKLVMYPKKGGKKAMEKRPQTPPACKEADQTNVATKRGWDNAKKERVSGKAMKVEVVNKPSKVAHVVDLEALAKKDIGCIANEPIKFDRIKHLVQAKAKVLDHAMVDPHAGREDEEDWKLVMYPKKGGKKAMEKRPQTPPACKEADQTNVATKRGWDNAKKERVSGKAMIVEVVNKPPKVAHVVDLKALAKKDIGCIANELIKFDHIKHLVQAKAKVLDHAMVDPHAGREDEEDWKLVMYPKKGGKKAMEKRPQTPPACKEADQTNVATKRGWDNAKKERVSGKAMKVEVVNKPPKVAHVVDLEALAKKDIGCIANEPIKFDHIKHLVQAKAKVLDQVMVDKTPHGREDEEDWKLVMYPKKRGEKATDDDNVRMKGNDIWDSVVSR